MHFLFKMHTNINYLSLYCFILKVTSPTNTIWGKSYEQRVSPVVPNKMVSAIRCLTIYLLTNVLMEPLKLFLRFQKALENLVPTRELDSAEMEVFQTA